MPFLDHFGTLAPFYEFFIPPKSPEKIRVLAGLPTSGALLDAGGGTGRMAQLLRDQAAQVIVADLSCKMLREARKKDGLSPVCAQTECMPFPDQSFARILMVDALHHVCDQRQTASEFWRLLQPGGRILIEEPDVRTLAVKLLALGEKLAFMRSHFLSAPQISNLFLRPEARVHVEQEGPIAWVIVEKNRESD